MTHEKDKLLELENQKDIIIIPTGLKAIFNKKNKKNKKESKRILEGKIYIQEKSIKNLIDKIKNLQYEKIKLKKYIK